MKLIEKNLNLLRLFAFLYILSLIFRSVDLGIFGVAIELLGFFSIIALIIHFFLNKSWQKIRLNKIQKIIWSAYLIILFWAFINSSSWDYSGTAEIIFFFGWIPALILHFVWREKKTDKEKKD